MSKSTVAAGQLSLWDMVEQDEKPASKKIDFIPNALYPHMPEYIMLQERWADGDTSPRALQRLVDVLLEIGVEVFTDSCGDKYKYIAAKAEIIDGEVWCTWQFQRKLARSIPHGDDKDVE